MKYAVMTYVGGDWEGSGWENVWMDDDSEPVYFETRCDTERELKHHIRSCREQVERGNLIDFDVNDFCIHQVWSV